MKTGIHLLGTGGIIAVTACLTALVWFTTTATLRLQLEQTQARVKAVLTGQALASATQLEQQIAVVDQTLRQVAVAWGRDAASVDLTALRNQATAMNGLAKDLLLANETGVVSQSTLPDAIGQSVTGQDYFIAISDRNNHSNSLFLGAAGIGPILRQWHVNAARALRSTDGSFAGVVSADYRIDAITEVLGQSALGGGGLALVVGLTDGKLRAIVGVASGDLDIAITDSPLFSALKSQNAGIWTGRSPVDAVTRIHAFRRIPDRNLVVAVAMDEQEALAPALAWQGQSLLAATGTTVLLLAVAWLLARRLRVAARASAATRQREEDLASANAQTEVYRVVSTARTEQLVTTLAGAADGICIIDAQMCLAEWNERFPAFAGVPAENLRIGIPFEEILRMQVASGQFGAVENSDVEIARRMARLRTGSYPTIRRQRPDGRTIEVRRKPLPEGGFVTFFADITDLTRAEEALRQSRLAEEAANAAKFSFNETAIREIRPRLDGVLIALTQLAEAPLDVTQQRLVAGAQQAGASLASTVDYVEELNRLEAGAPIVRRTLVDVRKLVEQIAETEGGDRSEQGVSFQVVVAPSTPGALYTDASLVRRILTLQIDITLRQSRGRTVVVETHPARSATEGIVLVVRAEGPGCDLDICSSPPGMPARHGAPAQGDGSGADLQQAICGKLASLLDGSIGCELLPNAGGEIGNAVWLALPPEAVPVRAPMEERSTGSGNGDSLLPSRRRLPRTRVLLVEDVPANQMVTATLLRREGHLVDIAASGAEAIEAARTAPYDLIFMDILMPGMNGQAAAAAIRALPEPARSVPILALTADGSTGDEDALARASLDGILGKPVTLTELLDVIGEFVWYRHDQERRSERPLRIADDRMAVPHVLAIDRLLELRTNLSPETFVRLVEECLLDLENQMPSLRRAISDRDTGAVTANAHAMVGMAAGYGMASLETALRAVLNAVRTGNWAALGRDPIAQVDAELWSATRALREMMQDVLA